MKQMKYPSERILMGPGPSNVPPRVLEAMSRPLVGHLDPEFIQLMNEIQDSLRKVFQTGNRLTLPISGTGSAGMEASVVNFVEPGDPVLVGVNGVFGMRLAEEMRRNGAECTEVRARWGEPLPLDQLANAADKIRPRIIAVVHAETSTGVLQPIEPIREICDRMDSLLLVDTVTSLGGHPVAVDDWKIDICYSGTQKCLSCPPGLSPFTISDRAHDFLLSRDSKVHSWYLDLTLVQNYWGENRTYHHTAPISMNYALHESLRIILEETLEKRWHRHHENHLSLVRGLQALRLHMHVQPEYRLWSLNTVSVPDGVDEASVRRKLLTQYNLEIGAGLGELQGKVWRIGLMGETSRKSYVYYFLEALASCLNEQGFKCSAAEAIAAAV
jgi:alanine-glyoxylate transaminase/serine-glyoxylate transaminase/serine-pyruvate transaminase